MGRRLAVPTLPYTDLKTAIGRVIDGALLIFLIFSALSITVAQAALLLALVAWALRLLLAEGFRQLRLPLLLPMAGFFLASVLATLTAVDPYLSGRELRNIFQPALFYLVVNHVMEEERATTLTRVLIAVGALVSGYGMWQAVTKGVDFRVHGTLSIYMTFAGVLMLIDTLALGQALFTTLSRRTLWLVPALLLLTAALLMTHTRGAWLGLAAGVSLIVWLRKKRWLLTLPLAALAIFLLVPHAVQARIGSVFDPQDVTARERLYMWGSGLMIIRDHPWTGVGMEGLKRVYRDYKHPMAYQERTSHLHNNVLQVAVERGLIGLAVWLWLWAAYVRHAWRIYGSLGPQEGGSRALVVGSLAGVTGFHVTGFFEYTFGDSEVIMLVYFLMALPFLLKTPAWGLPTPQGQSGT
ncbi:MAG: O-antigen ligase family protein [Nitrospinae bacterium]|nr:O-antigen ligase family protein [Nitrospinota bacterium]